MTANSRLNDDLGASPDILQYVNPSIYLRDVLKQKQVKNPRFSLRSFAKTLGLPTSTLNALVTGSRRISPSHSVTISSKLALSSLEQTYFQLLAVSESSRGTAAESLLTEKIDEIAWLIRAQRRDAHSTLGFEPEWFHLALAIWAGRSSSSSRKEIENFGLKLGLSPEQSRDAISALIAHQVLATAGNDRITLKSKRLFLSSDRPNPAFRKIHKTMLERAIEALDASPAGTRYSASEFLTFDDEGLKRFREITDQYLDQLHYEASRSARPDRLYSVALHCFVLGDSV